MMPEAMRRASVVHLILFSPQRRRLVTMVSHMTTAYTAPAKRNASYKKSRYILTKNMKM